MSKLYHRKLLKSAIGLNMYKYKLTSGDMLNDTVYKLGTDVDKNLKTRKSLQVTTKRSKPRYARYGYIPDEVLEDLGISLDEIDED